MKRRRLKRTPPYWPTQSSTGGPAAHPRTDDRGPRTEDRGPRTEDRRPRTEDRGLISRYSSVVPTAIDRRVCDERLELDSPPFPGDRRCRRRGGSAVRDDG